MQTCQKTLQKPSNFSRNKDFNSNIYVCILTELCIITDLFLSCLSVTGSGVCMYQWVCSVVLVQVKQQWVVMRPSTPQHLSSPFLLQKNRDKREESQPEWVWMFQFHWQPSVSFNFSHDWFELCFCFLYTRFRQNSMFLHADSRN